MLRSRTTAASHQSHDDDDRNEDDVEHNSKIRGSYNDGSNSERALEVLIFVAIVLFVYVLLQPYYKKSGFGGSGEVNNYDRTSSSSLKSNSIYQKYSYDAPTSCYPLSTKEDVTYTLVVHSTSVDQLWHMKYHCKLWNGPISLAVDTTTATNNHRKQTLPQIEHMIKNDMECSSEKITVQVLDSTASKAKGGAAAYHPVNELRNLALRSVETTHIMIIDIDLWVSEDLYSMLQSPLLRMTMYKNEKLVGTCMRVCCVCFPILHNLLGS